MKRLAAISAQRRAVPAANPLPVPGAQISIPANASKFRCSMAYPASSEYELDLKEGDVITMLKARDDGWCKGLLERTGKVGLFPMTFVQKIS